jgi:2-dehydropantoate 2-reductase
VKLDNSEDRVLWTKTAYNAATNPLGTLTGRTNGELVAIPALRELLLGALKEAALAARAARHPVPYSFLKGRLLAGLTAAHSQSNSMLQDLRAGRPTELDAIVTPLLKAASQKHLKLPLLESLARFTRRLEQELR